MESTLTLLVTRGPLAGRKFAFSTPITCIIGRSRDCTIPLPMEAEHMDVSRRHCLVEIAPPSVRIRDLGSLNGTFVNGKKIGQRTAWENRSEDGTNLPSTELVDGDEIRLGEHTAFRVCIFSPSEQEDTTKKRRRSSGELRFEVPVHS